MIEKKNKHLTLEDRIEIQDCLLKGMTFKSIGKHLGKDQTTISKEVKLHMIIKPASDLPKNKDGKTISEPCPILLKAPFVCNGCQRVNVRCSHNKCLYYAKHAQQQYQETLSSSREGIPLNKESFYEMDAVLTECVNKGQHLYHIMKTHDLGVSKSTVYRHLNKGYLSVSKMAFPRAVKFKARKHKNGDFVPKGLRTGRIYADYLNYIKEHSDLKTVEMDTVIGKIGGKVIMTFLFPKVDFMFGILMPNKSANAGAEAIKGLKKKFQENSFEFSSIFPIILTDNGGEFANVFAFENNEKGEKEISLFFCDPNRPDQKPNVEKNHTLFRDIVPKGESFDEFTQDTVNLIFSHVNSIRRKELNGKSPYELFSFIYGKQLPSLLGIQEIPSEQVIQSPKLLRPSKD